MTKEELEQYCHKASLEISNMQNEIDRLNYIINEFEKDIEEAYYELQDDDFINGKFMLKNFLDDLKELKETK